MDANTDKLDEMLGANATKDGKNIVINVTNNYNNSFNRDDHSDHSTHSDLSTGKNINKSNNVTTTHTNSHNTTNSEKPDKLSVSVSADIDKGSNNNNNSNSNNDTKDSKVQEFASGYSVDDVFAFLESEEPLSAITEATTKPPKGSLTNAMMNLDKESRKVQQKSKRTVQKSIGATKTLLKPAMRTKQWLAGVVDSLIKRNEDTVKTEIIESPGYRSTLFKATRLALKFGMFGIALTINPYIGAAYAALEVSRGIDKERLRREVQGEMATEMKILDDKIQKADEAGDNKSKWEMMRLRSKMERIVSDTPRSVVKHGRSVS